MVSASGLPAPPSVEGLAPKALLLPKAPPLNAPPPELNAPPPNPPDEPKVDGPFPENAPKPVAGLMAPAPNEPNAELVDGLLPKGGFADGCGVFPKDPNIAFAFALDLGSPPRPRDIPLKPDVSGAMESSVADAISTEMEGVDNAGAEGGDSDVDGFWVPNPNDVLPNADGAPENALNPKAPPELGAADVVGGEDPNVL